MGQSSECRFGIWLHLDRVSRNGKADLLWHKLSAEKRFVIDLVAPGTSMGSNLFENWTKFNADLCAVVTFSTTIAVEARIALWRVDAFLHQRNKWHHLLQIYLDFFHFNDLKAQFISTYWGPRRVYYFIVLKIERKQNKQTMKDDSDSEQHRLIVNNWKHLLQSTPFSVNSILRANGKSICVQVTTNLRMEDICEHSSVQLFPANFGNVPPRLRNTILYCHSQWQLILFKRNNQMVFQDKEKIGNWIFNSFNR